MRIALISMMLTAAVPVARAGDTMRCGDRLVATEALAAEVLAACGEPDYRDRTQRWGPYADEEEWIYNFGANQFLRVLRFRQGELVSIAADGYGFDTPPAPPCRPGDIVAGLSKFRLLQRCGAPLTRETFPGPRPFYREDGTVEYPAVRTVRRERWVYDFGADARMRIVTLESGRVTDVSAGARGSDPR